MSSDVEVLAEALRQVQGASDKPDTVEKFERWAERTLAALPEGWQLVNTAATEDKTDGRDVQRYVAAIEAQAREPYEALVKAVAKYVEMRDRWIMTDERHDEQWWKELAHQVNDAYFDMRGVLLATQKDER